MLVVLGLAGQDGEVWGVGAEDAAAVEEVGHGVCEIGGRPGRDLAGGDEFDFRRGCLRGRGVSSRGDVILGEIDRLSLRRRWGFVRCEVLEIYDVAIETRRSCRPGGGGVHVVVVVWLVSRCLWWRILCKIDEGFLTMGTHGSSVVKAVSGKPYVV